MLPHQDSQSLLNKHLKREDHALLPRRLGEMTQQEQEYNKGKAFCTRKNVIAVRVDISGNPIDDTMHFVPDGFLCSNVHLLPDDIAGAGIAGAGRCSVFLTTWCGVRHA
jgi:hypothetical protein